MPRPDAARRRAGAGAGTSIRLFAECTTSRRVDGIRARICRAVGGRPCSRRAGREHLRVERCARARNSVGRAARGRPRASASSASARLRAEWTASVRVYVVQSAASRALGAGRRHPASRGRGRTRNSAGRMARVRGAATCLRLLGECTSSRRVDGIRARLCRAVGGRSCTRPGRRHLARRGCGRAGRGRAGARRPRRAGRAARTPRRLRRGTRARPPRGPRRRGRWSGG